MSDNKTAEAAPLDLKTLESKADKIRKVKGKTEPKQKPRTRHNARKHLEMIERQLAGEWIPSHVAGIEIKMITRPRTPAIIAVGSYARTIKAAEINEKREKPLTHSEKTVNVELKAAESDAQMAERFLGLRGEFPPFSDQIEVIEALGVETYAEDDEDGDAITWAIFTGDEDVDAARDIFWRYCVPDFQAQEEMAAAFRNATQKRDPGASMAALNELLAKVGAAKN